MAARFFSLKIVVMANYATGERIAGGMLIKVGSNPHNLDQPLGEFYFAFKVNVTTP